MNLLIPPSNISRQWHPCPKCEASIPIDVMSVIESDNDFAHFCIKRLNRAQCCFCGSQVEAPVRVIMMPNCEEIPNHDCVPLALLKDPEILDDLLHNNPEGLRRVYSIDELERSIEACIRLHVRRRGLTMEEFEAESPA